MYRLRSLGTVLCCGLALAAQAQTLPADGQAPALLFAEPPALQSVPASPYVGTQPDDFVVVPQQHEFSDSQPPTVVDTQPRLFRRTYDPQRGVYVDTEVRALKPIDPQAPASTD
ncbi:hypothetical protein [Pseudomonas abieticivorans]|uniref:hypothetical protein n=1 Tax=Pseudomonas abieticivorans TaxID=2931382 RepID=UPI0020BF162B|nr:hypothetical protein [Pseudomonas sp. PIA16]